MREIKTDAIETCIEFKEHEHHYIGTKAREQLAVMKSKIKKYKTLEHNFYVDVHRIIKDMQLMRDKQIKAWEV